MALRRPAILHRPGSFVLYQREAAEPDFSRLIRSIIYVELLATSNNYYVGE